MSGWTVVAGVVIGLALGSILWDSILRLNRSGYNKEERNAPISLHEHRSNDFSYLIDMRNFSYTLDQTACNTEIQALIFVPSAPLNQERRRLIRHTWANVVELPHLHSTRPFRIIFLLGMPATAEEQRALERENFEYGDIVQGSFIDNYMNMTYKHVMALKWFLFKCAHAQILIKVDDDVFLNTPQLLIYLHNAMLHNAIPQKEVFQRGEPQGAALLAPIVPNEANMIAAEESEPTERLFRRPRDLLFCNLQVGARVHRHRRSKWRMSFRQYRKRMYPPYCPGFVIIYSSDVVQRLYTAAQQTEYFWIDDVHITGHLAQKLNISITESVAYLRDYSEPDVVYDESEEFLYIYPVVKPNEMHQWWRTELARVRAQIKNK